MATLRKWIYQYEVYKTCPVLWRTLSSPSLMHDLDPACTMTEKTGQHIVQPFGAEIAVCQVIHL